MNWVFSSIMFITLVQIIIGKQLRWWLLLLPILIFIRIAFLMRMKGIVVKSKPLWITEAVLIFFEFVLGVVSKKGINILLFMLYILLSLTTVLIEIIDDKFYVYKVEDEKTED